MIKLLTLSLLLISSMAWAKPSEVVLQTIAMESAGESDRGMALVVLTLANRARDRHTSMEIEAKRHFQYSAWDGGGKWAKAWLGSYWGPKVRYRAIKALSEGLALSLNPQFQGIKHYHARGVHPAWAKGHKAVIVEGLHLFYEGIK